MIIILSLFVCVFLFFLFLFAWHLQYMVFFFTPKRTKIEENGNLTVLVFSLCLWCLLFRNVRSIAPCVRLRGTLRVESCGGSFNSFLPISRCLFFYFFGGFCNKSLAQAGIV